MPKNQFGVWDDLVADLSGRRLSSVAGKVDYDYDENAVKFQSGGSLSNSADRVTVNYQFSHSTYFGTGAKFHWHYHWWQPDAKAYVISYRYRIQQNGSSKTTAWTTGSYTVGTGGEAFTYSSGTINQISELVEIDIAGLALSDTIQIQFARTDSETGDILGYFVDGHYMKQSNGSKQEYSE